MTLDEHLEIYDVPGSVILLKGKRKVRVIPENQDF